MAEQTPYTLVELLKKANSGYPDGFLTEYFNEYTGALVQGAGDSLARFIVGELSGTFDDSSSREDQVAGACRVLEKGCRDLQRVITALYLD